eukprot:TRINITY_DN863_c1_g1_i1.p2 TRINITY_DN863_c1_g1~~TRINITY_DN863_c1_g1_i1.p2  ORF type:complete len:167 (-),score=21.26 TRINITY_DN863_c1_g1_i1:115-588(-)
MCPRADHVTPAATPSDARNLQYLCRMWSAKKGAPHATRPSKAASQSTRPTEHASVHCVPRLAAIPGAQSAPTASPAAVWVAFPHASIPHCIQAQATTLPKSQRPPPTHPAPMVIPSLLPFPPLSGTPAAVRPVGPQAWTSIDTLMDPSLDLLFSSFA